MQILKTTTIVSVLSLLLSACGGGSDSPLITGPGNSSSVSSGIVDTTTPTSIGFGNGSAFAEGTIGVGGGNTSLDASGSRTLTINIVSSTNTLVTSPTQVTFNSRCYAAEEATLMAGNTATNKVSTEVGEATITYNAKGCVGDDEVTATAIIGGVSKVAKVTLTVAQDTVQSIRFVDAIPDKIYLKDSGGAQTSTVRFLVLGRTGAPIKNIPLKFTLSTQLGGIALTATEVTTDKTGHASTIVQAGTIPTAVEVIATEPQSSITSRSNKLSIGTGIPDQDSMSISATRFNPPGWEYDGEEVGITIRLADAYNNPPPDGTSVVFTTEGGVIDNNCTTVNGVCDVIWKSQTPRPSNGRVTILATTVGNESFEDVDGDGLYTFGTDNFNTHNTGGNCDPNVPLSTASATPGGNDSPCDDLGEAYLDKNEDGQHQNGEDYRDFNINKKRDTENGIYNGVLCITEGANCTKEPVNIRQDIVLVMSSEMPLTQNGLLLGQPDFIEMGANETYSFTVTLADINGNAMPLGTTISLVTSTASDVTINHSMTGGVANTTAPTRFSVTLKANETKRPTGRFNIVVTSPKGTSYSFSTRLAPKPLDNSDAIYMGKSVGTTFLVGQIDVGIGNAVLPPGGTTSLSVNLVDGANNLTNGAAQVTFSSPCITQGTAILTDASGQETNTVTTQTGRATIIYKAVGCMGTDVVTAVSSLPSLQVNTATATLNITEVSAQNIAFNSATPSQISLKGVGGVEISNVSFTVNGSNGQPLAGVPVTLTLNNTVGGVCLTGAGGCTSEISTISNASGIITGFVQAGTIATTVRVTASAEANGVTISTQSSGLVISTGIPDQDSMSISASQYNVPRYIEGFEVDVTIRMADAFNNPAPEGTSVSFTTSGGSIDGSCSLNNTGACTVKWRNQNPRPASGKITILATAIGNESFIDSNGNGVYDVGDAFAFGGGNCALNAPKSTWEDPATACDDLGEAYLDSNQNKTYTPGEVFIDIFDAAGSVNKDGIWTPGNGKYDGALCSNAAFNAGRCTRNTVTVRDDLMLVLSGSEADTTGKRLIGQPASISLATDPIQTFTVILRDNNGNSLPAGTTVTVDSTNLTGASVSLNPVTVLVASNITGPTTFDVVVKRDAGAASGQFQLVVTTPNGAPKAYTTNVTAL